MRPPMLPSPHDGVCMQMLTTVDALSHIDSYSQEFDDHASNGERDLRVVYRSRIEVIALYICLCHKCNKMRVYIRAYTRRARAVMPHRGSCTEYALMHTTIRRGIGRASPICVSPSLPAIVPP